jgi:hypothetical protein
MLLIYQKTLASKTSSGFTHIFCRCSSESAHMALTHRGSPPIAFGKTPLLLLLPRLPLQIAEKCRVRLATYSALCSLLSALSLSLSLSRLTALSVVPQLRCGGKKTTLPTAERSQMRSMTYNLPYCQGTSRWTGTISTEQRENCAHRNDVKTERESWITYKIKMRRM